MYKVVSRWSILLHNITNRLKITIYWAFKLFVFNCLNNILQNNYTMISSFDLEARSKMLNVIFKYRYIVIYINKKYKINTRIYKKHPTFSSQKLMLASAFVHAM